MTDSKTQTLSIIELGARGDGIAETETGPAYVAHSLPGETVRAELNGAHGRAVEIITPSADRIAPSCAHFGRCGGCALQHMAAPAYLTWKRQMVAKALTTRRLDAEVDPVFPIGPGTRRRAVFAARRTRKTVQLGFHTARDDTIIDIAQCPILHPQIVAALPGLKQLVGPLLTRRGESRITVTVTLDGLDVVLDGLREEISRDELAALADTAAQLKLVRLSIGRNLVAAQATPQIAFADIQVPLPVGGTFLQASVEADKIMAKIVTDALIGALTDARHVADLFCGLGTLTLPIARHSFVTAIDADRPALDALEDAVRHSDGLKPVTVKRRDLYLEPLADKELTSFDAVVFDPPRAGAKAQAQALAASAIPLVIAISCNPSTLARDLSILTAGGYQLTSVQPIDQFIYSAHVETIAVLRR